MSICVIMPELLFELGCEEIPAEDLFVLPDELMRLASQAFEANRLAFSGLEVQVTPRRLFLFAEMESWQSDLREERLGPPKKVAIGADGNPAPAGLGFAKNLGLPFDQLKIVQTPKGEYLAGEILVKGRLTAEILKELVPGIIGKLPFKKFMKWGSGTLLFGRPIRNLLFLFDGEVVPLTVAGVDSGNSTFGHRFLGSRKIEVRTNAEYRQKLHENGVVLKFEDRLALIETQLHEQIAAAGGRIKQDPDLARVMANEVEYPEVLTGSFSREFLHLPQEILINAMRKHQKYFCAVDQGGKLLPCFFTVLNTRADKPDLIRQGHERVLKARLRDAEFFWHEDLKTKLEDRMPLLGRLTYHEKLGPEHKFYNMKVRRMLSVAEEIFRQLDQSDKTEQMNRLIHLCKADLLTLMVGEFPELQGIMGGLYAQQQGHAQDDWQALYDQYLPVSAEDVLPRNFTGALLSLIDRTEILLTGFILNMVPTGSKDPYGLRRVATGAMRIILDYGLNLDLRRVFEWAVEHAPTTRSKMKPPELTQALTELMEARFRFLMEQKGIAHDTINAILGVERRSFVHAAAKANALWAKHGSEDLNALARGFKRINNIISDQPHHALDTELFEEDGEKSLYRLFNDLRYRVEQLISERQYLDALDIMVTLGPEIDNFFDEVLVMAENEKLKNNRIALLQEISDLYRRIADFSALQIEL